MAGKPQKTCRKGHPFTDANTITYSGNRRRCRICTEAYYDQRQQEPCSVSGCSKPLKALGLCAMHWQRQHHTGTTDARPRHTLEERVWSQIDVRGPDECWPWTGTKFAAGYGLVHIDRVPHVVHRIIYELAIGPIPDGLQIDHTCHNRSECEGGPTCPHRACENPAHLRPKTIEDNLLSSKQTLASINQAKTHCKWGHEFTAENTKDNGRGGRACRECGRRRWREYWKGRQQRAV